MILFFAQMFKTLVLESELTISPNRTYFPNLHGLRFIAAAMVFVHHMEQALDANGLSNAYTTYPALFLLGKLGVVLFFVLSGFLITYLLLEEESVGSINVKNFYFRRVLRIWPLYYLIVGLSLFVFPHFEFFTLNGWSYSATDTTRLIQILLYLFLFANLALKVAGPLLHASHTWSIGTEEQFYLIWPLLIKYIKRCRILLLISIIVGYMGLNYFFQQPACGVVPYNVYITKFLDVFNIDCMAIGGLVALLLYRKSFVLKFILRIEVLVGSVILSLGMIYFNVRVPYFTYELYAVPFVLIILNLSSNGSITNLLENRFFHYLGNVSYGLYMYQPLMVFLSIKIFAGYLPDQYSVITLYVLSGILTVAVSGISYRYFETPFLKLKSRFI